METPLAAIKTIPLRRMIDYSYGLALADMHMNVMQDGGIHLSLALHNAADGPICFQFEKIEFKMNGCILASTTPAKHKAIIVARGMHNIYPCPPLKRISVNPTPQVGGNVVFAIKYGHPDEVACRRAEWDMGLTLIIAPPQPRIAMVTNSHSETAINETLQ